MSETLSPEPASDPEPAAAAEAVREAAPEPGVVPAQAVPAQGAPAEAVPAQGASAQAAPPQPVPGNPYALPPHPAAEPVRPLRPSPRVRVALRWTALLLVFGVFGAGTAYAVTLPERTRIPGLKTPADGRWTYPRLALPGLPPHMPRPLDTARNPGGVHHADLRTLLVPEPEKAVNDPAFPGAKGWLDPAVYAKVQSADTAERRKDVAYLKDQGLRHIAARAWTMPDGTRAEVYLLQFISSAFEQPAEQHVDSHPPVEAEHVGRDVTFLSLVPHGIEVTAYNEKAPYGDVMTRYALVESGDTLAVVRLTRKGGAVPTQAFKQTVVLQAQLLG